MNRRSFLSAAAIAPAVAAVPVSAGVIKPGGRRLSTESGDPGYLAWAETKSDGQTVHVYLDGESQKDAVTADETLGMVKRTRRTAKGNLMIDPVRDEIMMEMVYGDVRIEID